VGMARRGAEYGGCDAHRQFRHSATTPYDLSRHGHPGKSPLFLHSFLILHSGTSLCPFLLLIELSSRTHLSGGWQYGGQPKHIAFGQSTSLGRKTPMGRRDGSPRHPLRRPKRPTSCSASKNSRRMHIIVWPNHGRVTSPLTTSPKRL
jgi:hypothetical protein